MKISKSIIAMAAVAAMALPATDATAGNLDFTYNVDGVPAMMWGTNAKTQTYDVAIRIDDPALVGAKVLGFNVLVPGMGTSGFSGWMTKELKVEKKVNKPDICSKDATVGGDEFEMLEVTFDQPYTITADGVYVGYTFTVDEVKAEFTEYPVALVPGDDPNGFFIHSSRSYYRWMTNMVEKVGGVSTMVVKLEGDFYADAASAAIESVNYAPVKEKRMLTLGLVNHGTNPLSSIEYSYKAGTVTGTGTATLAQPVPAVFGMRGTTEIEISPIAELGEYDLSVTIDKVNGQVNNDKGKTAQGTLEVWPFLPVNRPLVEEFTGLWCGFCPRGYVALETLNAKYPQEFVAVAYHNDDPMATVAAGSYPVGISGFPYAAINRMYGFDPGETEDYWTAVRAMTMPQAKIDVDIDWADDAHTKLAATAKLNFATDQAAADYKIAYMLVADDLKSPDWAQTNYYTNTASYGTLTGRFAELFNGTTDKVNGLEYNDVIINGEQLLGVANSVPATITAGKEITHTYEFEIPETFQATALKEPTPIPVIKDRLRVVAALVDVAQQGVVINSASSKHVDGTEHNGIGSVTVDGTDSEVIATEYYDLTGRRVANPATGLFIKAERHANGALTTSKVAVK